jgi:ATP-dependent 26S proteasome regulatory subunit
MNIADLPPALVRSGRIELWLETALPDAVARQTILERHLTGLPADIGDADVARLVEATDGFTGADLGPVINDGKNLMAFDKAQQRACAAPTEYFLTAARSIRANKERYLQARHEPSHCEATVAP